MTRPSARAEYALQESCLEATAGLVLSHVSCLAYPLDSFLEDQLRAASIHVLYADGRQVGYAATSGETLQFLHVQQEQLHHGPALLALAVERLGVTGIRVMTQDPLLVALVSEWDFDKVKQSCWFTDSGREVPSIRGLEGTGFREAELADVGRVHRLTAGFFGPERDGPQSLEARVREGTIFLLEQGQQLLGAGIVELGQLCRGSVSIGMFTPPEHRQRGVARSVLLQLKRWAYDRGLQPLAGCWYYNTLSRRALESAGMVATSLGYLAVLRGREDVPLQTGEPAG